MMGGDRRREDRCDRRRGRDAWALWVQDWGAQKRNNAVRERNGNGVLSSWMVFVGVEEGLHRFWWPSASILQKKIDIKFVKLCMITHTN